MQLELYQIDSFTDKIFHGNPACVVPLKEWLPDEILLKITRENAVAETAFFIDKGETIHLRWFTPEIEMDLCGHATLAVAHCLVSILNYKGDRIIFETKSGLLTVEVKDGMYYMDFPSRIPEVSTLPDIIVKSLNIQPKEVFQSRDYVLVYESEQDIKKVQIERSIFDTINLDPGGVVITSVGSDCDFVSRYFTPQSTILEDPVTGSAHCSLIPFWSSRLGKDTLFARQISERGGELYCENKEQRVIVAGKARTYSVGHIYIE
ncbi:PhzF family phenazine biosynthesis protein [Myroides marinus]|uniref:PhzF family phenazine biosynthesis protein n=1 Tax=Myroides marinus TaxID=703342 RepID=UPI002575EBB2|nr:PhzF family phenazine biosynthesis protein [Myroides marinus]MDM1347624.1 PhzF family phenazine biosynthesis protein [Myroides marinus]MDM1352283.1 PhzF family phenazine biosynthesis protein [Myroides marinus]MDM1359515.1 PhzF family phenazine biosynthesis protein [Myroides marinus]MDM1363096.1 PhzF family phenazine biosynthesis protein [Myroides marinus]MDM1366635.1 PhzF family phenazine biosynthesis protein [Myroides marinus]